MNYANMIEEKNLKARRAGETPAEMDKLIRFSKKTFIIATLCSTLIGTFTSSMGLWDRVSEKRRQKHRDTRQDAEIKQLKDQVERNERDNRERSHRERDDLGDALGRSGALIRHEYDQGYEHLGRRFAVGDTLTENQLQAQIIALQQTVIQVLQDALYNGRDLSRADMSKLMAASHAARDGSLDALRSQSQRLAMQEPVERALPPPKRSSTSSAVELDSIFCRYSLDLQYVPHKPLAAAFAPDGSSRCPACGVRLDVEPADVWHIGKRTPVIVSDGRYEKEVLEEREFRVGQRFVVKCHTADGDYACTLCNKGRDVDVVCGSVDTLINHVGRAHSASELERDRDVCETSFDLPKALEVPKALPPPVGVKEVRERRLTLPDYR